MATYTAVLVTANELSQDDVVQVLERAGVVAFCGPGSLVSEDALSDEEITATERETLGPDGVMATSAPDAATVGLAGLRVRVQVAQTDDGPLLSLYGENCGLEGDMPGEYYLVPVGQGARTAG